MPAPLTILHHADSLVVVDKPAGIVTIGNTLAETECVQYRLAQQLGRDIRKVWGVHQLDRGTSGVNLFVLRKSLVAEWQKKLAGGQKRYRALVHGAPPWERLRVDLPLHYDREAGRSVERATSAGGKSAQTELRVLARTADGRFACVEARPKTGRTHQVRAHLAMSGFPLVGEWNYRDPACALYPNAALHCRVIAAAGHRFQAPLPTEWLALAASLGFVDTDGW